MHVMMVVFCLSATVAVATVAALNTVYEAVSAATTVDNVTFAATSFVETAVAAVLSFVLQLLLLLLLPAAVTAAVVYACSSIEDARAGALDAAANTAAGRQKSNYLSFCSF